jgi:hypothetical protein
MSNIMVMQYLRAKGADDRELDPEKYCERGLESYQSKERRNEIDAKRKLHQWLVIREQARQAVLGTNDPERLRLMASSYSEGSLLKAQLRAALDQHEVTKSGEGPLSEEEKLQVALQQHNKMMQEKQRQALDEIVKQKLREEAVANAPIEIDDPASGIVKLSSLWAQESELSPSIGFNTKAAEIDILGSTRLPHPMQSSPVFLDSRESPVSVQEMMPLMSFKGFSQPPNVDKVSGSTVPSQAIQNAFCSSAHTPVVTVMPTAAFAAMQILEQQQQRKLQQVQQNPLSHEQLKQQHPSLPGLPR